MTSSQEEPNLNAISFELRRLADELAKASIPAVAARIGGGGGGGGLGIFDCEDYKCDDSFTCTDFKCSGGDFKCNDVFKISRDVTDLRAIGGSGFAL